MYFQYLTTLYGHSNAADNSERFVCPTAVKQYNETKTDLEILG